MYDTLAQSAESALNAVDLNTKLRRKMSSHVQCYREQHPLPNRTKLSRFNLNQLQHYVKRELSTAIIMS